MAEWLVLASQIGPQAVGGWGMQVGKVGKNARVFFFFLRVLEVLLLKFLWRLAS